MIIMMHVMTASILWAVTAVAWLGLRRCGDLTLSRPAVGLVGLVGLQIALGIAAWVVNYGWPSILEWVPGSADFLIRAKGFSDAIIVTGHVATGSLILAVSAMLTARVWRERSKRRAASMARVIADVNESEPAVSSDSVPPTVFS